MSMILKNSVFVHIPKTGGSWVVKALKDAEIVSFKTKWKHPSYQEMKALLPPEKLKGRTPFAFVRNPVTWWQSRWSDPFMRQFYADGDCPRKNWVGNIVWLHQESAAINQKELDNFNAFMDRVLDERPTFASEYLTFMLSPSKLVIGKYESLVEDLCGILFRLGEHYDVEVIKNTEKVNESDEAQRSSRKYKEKHLKRLLEAEKAFLEEHKYPTKLSDYEHLIL